MSGHLAEKKIRMIYIRFNNNKVSCAFDWFHIATTSPPRLVVNDNCKLSLRLKTHLTIFCLFREGNGGL